MADMNVTPSRATLTPQLWDKKYFAEYIRANRYARYMGKSENSMIVMKDDLTTKNGDSITYAATRRLVGAGVSGNTVLEGNEEILDSRGMKVRVLPIRHAVAISNWDEQKSVIDLRDAAKTSLKNWSMEKLRGDITIAFSAVGNGVPYATATATQRNTWLVNNSDRILFGSSVSNASSGVMATALANINNNSGAGNVGKMSGATLSLAKRRAQLASPHITPIRMDDENDEEWFVALMPSNVFRDFRNDPNVLAANKDARPRENGWMENPLFSGGDLVWDGVIVREIPELPVLTGVGASGIDAAASFLCGAAAIGAAWAKRTKTTTNVRDYDYFHGVGLEEIRGIQKLQFDKSSALDDSQLVDNGVFTMFTAAVADA